MERKEYIDIAEVRKAILTLQESNGVFEVRAIGTDRRDILSGYFREPETLLKAFSKIDFRHRNIYITLGKVKEECFARSQSECFRKSPQTTSDTEIVSYRWLFVDLDPVRTAGISSTDQELHEALLLAEKILDYMQSLGFCSPVRAMSGNGYHLLYRIDVPNDEEGRALIEKCLKVLANMFNTDSVKIDTTNSNPSRICKLHGTLAQKGRDTEDRPHRMSKLIRVPEKIEVTPIDTIKALADELPDVEPVNHRAGVKHAQTFDLLDFMSRHGMTYKEDSNDRAKIYRLDECPFDPSHKNGDSRIFLYHNGAIAFKCHHNSCKQYRWQDVRLKYEPDAYDDNGEEYDQGYQEHKAKVKAEQQEKPKPKQKPQKIRKLKTADELMKKDLPEPKVFVGLDNDLPLLVEGTCILSAKPKLGKSWLALSMCLAISEGREFLGYKTRKCSTLYLDLETSEQLQQKRIRRALNGEKVPKNFYLDNETDSIEKGFCEQIEAYLKEDPDIGVVVVDVFQIIRSPAKNFKESEYDHAYRDITPLNELAQKHHISIILVCHDRKAVDPDDPFSNILGSTGLQGAATQMMVMFRKRKDDPIHISVKGKTIDGLPELNVKLENAQWEIVEAFSELERENARLMEQYKDSDIRKAVVAIVKGEATWKGRCSALIQKAVEYDVPILETAKAVGGFLHKHQGRFLAEDNIKVLMIDNGTGPKIYKFEAVNEDYSDGFIPVEDIDKFNVYQW